MFYRGEAGPPLTVKQLCALHDALECHADPWTRLFAGAALVLYVRSMQVK